MNNFTVEFKDDIVKQIFLESNNFKKFKEERLNKSKFYIKDKCVYSEMNFNKSEMELLKQISIKLHLTYCCVYIGKKDTYYKTNEKDENLYYFYKNDKNNITIVKKYHEIKDRVHRNVILLINSKLV